MEFTIDRAELAQALMLTQGVVERRNTMPVLANVLLDARGDEGLSVVATALEVNIRRQCEAKVTTPGTATVAARKIYDFVRALRPGEVSIRLLENHFVEVVSGRSRLRLVGLPASEFPSFPRGDEKQARKLSFPAADLARMIDRTLFAVSTDETRAHLGGVYLCGGGDDLLRFVGTDGHRLAISEHPLPGAKLGSDGVILPRKGLAELRKLLDDAAGAVSLWLHASSVRAEVGSVEILMRLIDGEFPNYEQVVPESTKFKVAVSNADLLAALRRVSVVASERARGVKLAVSEGQLVVSASSPDFGEASEEIEVSYQGDEIAIGFNARYLTDALTVLPDDAVVEIGLTNDVSPGVLGLQDDESYRYIVMPMRL